MKKPKGILGYPAADLVVGDVVFYKGDEFSVLSRDKIGFYLQNTSDPQHKIFVWHGLSRLFRLVRKARGITYAAWQRQTSKLLKEQGLSRWPGAAVMKPLFFLSYSPEDAAAAFLSDNFLID